ncbi:hypothetical protein ACFFX1_54865 [Dactylosporangium sucinum]|uniref:Uncharacterized protein n=1 Tax=Dactylosporangium sucinum TaxID=1424081 RepID=A0A917U2F9_9ACTN|nr:hypothetical protein [Dactylosporangium sucinum]GGM53499.1 hypothetical protein GCM10007977_063860 [Dactylosporangium sucinum]
MAEPRLIRCQYRQEPHPLDDECVDVTDVPANEALEADLRRVAAAVDPAPPVRLGPYEEQPFGCSTCRTILNAQRAACSDPWHEANRPGQTAVALPPLDPETPENVALRIAAEAGVLPWIGEDGRWRIVVDQAEFGQIIGGVWLYGHARGLADGRGKAAEAVAGALPVLGYVSRGRRFVDVEPYPDAAARRALAALHDAGLAAGQRERSDDRG